MSLPKPYYQDEWVTIYHGDCREILPELPKVDAIITDPPFGIGFKYERKEEHDNPISYWKWLNPIYMQTMSRLKDGGFIAIWQTQLNYKHFWEWFGDDIHIYVAAKNFVQLRKTPIQYGYDPIIMKYNGVPELCPSKPQRNIDFYVANTAKWLTQTSSIIRQHPCPRPIDQVMEIVNNFVISNGTVIDPFLGSGTTAIASTNTNRHCIGIEIEEKYCEIAAKRCSQQVFDFTNC